MALSEGIILHGTYEILGILGQGGFAVTYRARHIRLNSGHAIKEYFPRGVAERSGTTVYPADGQEQKTNFNKGLNSFLSEARNLTKFSHPNIVSIQDYFQENGTAYLVMPYLAGETLDKVLAKCPGQKMNIQAMKQWLMPLLDGLAYLHANNFLHRDIKPSNIYLTDKATPILIDFGAARSDIGQLTHGYTIVFTPEYAPPEQHIANASAQGPWTDIYAIGAVMYRCLMGTPPPDSNARQLAVIHGEKDPIELAYGQIAAAANDDIANIVCRCLDLNSKTRIRSVGELQNLLDYSNSSQRKNTSANKTKDRQSEEIFQSEPQDVYEEKPKSPSAGGCGFWFAVMVAIGLIIFVVCVCSNQYNGQANYSTSNSQYYNKNKSDTSNINQNYNYSNSSNSNILRYTDNSCATMLSHIENGESKYDNGYYNDAISILNVAINSSCRQYEDKRMRGINILGKCYEKMKKYYAAFEMYKLAAEGGYNNARYNLAICYRDGLGVKRNESKAFDWFYEAAYHGDTDAAAQIAYYYEKHKDYKNALRWYEDAITNGNTDSIVKKARDRVKKRLQLYSVN